MFHVEPGEVVSGPACPCCAKAGRSSFGFVHRDGEPIAFYHAWIEPHRNRRVALMAISIGDWSHSGEGSSRRAAALRFESADGEMSAELVDLPAALFGGREALGRILSATDARDDLLLDEILAVAEAVALEDPEVNSHLA
jgi:hypothetical protein